MNAEQLGVIQPHEQPIQRSEEEVQRIMKLLSWMTKVYSGRYGIKVVALEGEGPWTCGIDPKYGEVVDKFIRGEIESIDDLPREALVPHQIAIRKNDLYTDPEIEIKRKARHEGAHATHTDFRLFFKGMREAADQGFLASTYASLFNGPEDGWINEKASNESEAALYELKKGYHEKLPEVLPSLPTDPLTRQFSVNAIYYWLTGADVPGLDPRVMEVMNKVRPSLDKFYASISAEENYHTFLEEIWPYARELEEKATHDEALNNLIEQIRQHLENQAKQQENQAQGQPQPQQEPGEGEGQAEGQEPGQEENATAQSKLPSDLQEKIKQDLQNQQNAQNQPPSQQGQEAGQGEESAGESTQQSSTGSNEMQQSAATPNGLNQLSEETRQELEAFWENLDQETKEELLKQARQALDKKQSEALNKEAPQIIQMEYDEETGEYVPKIQTVDPEEMAKAEQELEQFETQESEREAQAEQQQAQANEEYQKQRAAEQAKQKKEQAMRAEGFNKDEEELFDRYKQLEAEVRSEMQETERSLLQFFPKEEHIIREGYYYSGRPDAQQIAREFPTGGAKYHTRKNFIESPQINTYLWMVIDVSPSMDGVKIDMALKSAIMWCSLMEKRGVPTGIILMAGKATILKDPTQAFSKPEARIKAELIRQTNVSLHSGTNYEAAMDLVKEKLAESRRKFKGSFGMCMLWTDGGPNRGDTGKVLQEKIQAVKGLSELFAFGLTEGISSVAKRQMIEALKGYFGEERCILPETSESLTKETKTVMLPFLRRLTQKRT